MVVNFENLNTREATSTARLFADCSNITELYIRNLDTRNITSFHAMFDGYHNLEKLDISCLRRGNSYCYVNAMFWNCTNLKYLRTPLDFNTLGMIDAQLMKAGISNTKYF